MRYVSTRSKTPILTSVEAPNFEDVLLAGLACDGGLYVPESWPHFSQDEWRQMQKLDFAALGTRLIEPFVADCIPESILGEMIAKTYEKFDHQAVAPLRQLDHHLWILELFHGPTISFKDYALQLLGRMFDYVLTKRKKRITIVGATSGDTGSAAIEAVRNCHSMDIFMLHPQGRVSEVQRRQMTTVIAPNVYNLAVQGTFDDCQDHVKAMFADHKFRHQQNLSAMNSINWGRIMAQSVYYAYAALRLGAPERAVAVSVPSGNFGNVFAAWVTRQMGLPIEKFIVASNSNDILTRFFANNDMSLRAVVPTLAPSMDIQISSNFERLLFESMDRNGEHITTLMQEFRDCGKLNLPKGKWQHICDSFKGYSADDEAVKRVMKRIFHKTGTVLDPHSAIGVMAAYAHQEELSMPVISVATAHPAKFPDAVCAATGYNPGLPPHMAGIFDRQEQCLNVPNDTKKIMEIIREKKGL